ncbi:hypothetical protein SH83_03755 [Lactiplantibacillus plantarum]|uniref:relaxase/mobilization nuclease domain-containing protein n=1 Tax=Lactiplantibacillus plantarum TaxID=1590 RepID=UPI0005BEC474|nr:relaxase/mobilization nuclease domain-containing protein [Lactiplantibacillus plantarum]AJO73506.1 hypothetical protein SH83_03755 [Lactiplantibacillus plantarum]MCW0154409.1 relaxase/mobilization nuclease domain-containing protein [Lactiplantibacillus plantarum]
MVYVKSNSSTAAWGRLKYIFDGSAHDNSEQRVLAVTGSNIRLWGGIDNPYAEQSAYYLNQQFKRIRHRAWNKHKRHQAQHMILSFSESEFSINNPDTLLLECRQVNRLIKGFMEMYFSNSQWVSALQKDGIGSHHLHAHVLINSVKIDGKCVRTNNFKVFKLRNQWNKYLEENYLSCTGHVYVNPFHKDNPRKVMKFRGWQEQLHQTLEWARKGAESIEEYLYLLKGKGVTITERNKHGDWSYHMFFNNNPKTVRDFYQRIDRKTGQVKTTRGMGQAYTPISLKKHFKAKKQKETEKNEEIKTNSGRSERFARKEERQREQRFIKQLVNELSSDERDTSCNKARSSKFFKRSDVPAKGKYDDTGFGF